MSMGLDALIGLFMATALTSDIGLLGESMRSTGFNEILQDTTEHIALIVCSLSAIVVLSLNSVRKQFEPNRQ